MIRTFVLGLAAVLAFAAWTPSAQAGTRVSVGIGVGGGYYGGGYGGYYGRPYCGPYGRPYYGGYYGGGYGYRPYYAPAYYGAYYAPSPVVYVQQPQPVYVEQPQPVYVQAPSYSVNTWQVTQVQTQLGRLHYYNGSADGVIGPKTQNAVASFQQSRGLVVTGNINSQVLNALQIPL